MCWNGTTYGFTHCNSRNIYAQSQNLSFVVLFPVQIVDSLKTKKIIEFYCISFEFIFGFLLIIICEI